MATVTRKFKTVEEYVSSFSGPAKKALEAIRKTVRKSAPEAEEKISYNMPAYILNGFLVSFAAWKEHIGMYPRTSAMEASIKELSQFEGDKGTIKFPLDKPMPLDLIGRIVRFRIQENQAGGQRKKTRK